MCVILTLAALAALAEAVATGGRLVVVGVVALGTGLFLLAEWEGCLAELASQLVEREDGRGLVELGLVEPTSGW